MNLKQFNQARVIRGRIHELKVMQTNMERMGDKTKIGDCEIPKNSKEVILAMCKKEIDELENEFENL